MKFPRVLLTTYQDAFLIRGGGEYELFAISEYLRQYGFTVDIYGPYSRNIDNYDLILHFSVHPGGIEFLERLKCFGKPIVLWPNFWPTEDNAGLSDSISRHVDLASKIIFKSYSETSEFSARFRVPSEKIEVIPIIADEIYAAPTPKNLFNEIYQIENYAIWFGLIEPIKNQITAVREVSKRGMSLVLVGRHRDAAYLEMCKIEGGNNLLHIESLPIKSEITRSALQGAKFYIEISKEPPGLSSIEAGLAGCPLVLSDSSWTREIFGDYTGLCDPLNHQSISSAIDRVLNLEHPKSLSNKLLIHCSKELVGRVAAVLVEASK
jgi:glycosyltransferase involved in cell wall biosynthesis